MNFPNSILNSMPNSHQIVLILANSDLELGSRSHAKSTLLLSTAFVIQSFCRLDLLTADKLYPSYRYLLLLPTYLPIHFTVASTADLYFLF